MSAIDTPGEKIVRNLQQAVEELQRDVSRVEIWAGALGCFAKPIPDYGHGQTRFDLAKPNKVPPVRASAAPTQQHTHDGDRHAAGSANDALDVDRADEPDKRD